MDTKYKIKSEKLEEKLEEKSDTSETTITILFRKIKEYVQHVHTTTESTPLIELSREFMNMYTTVPEGKTPPHLELVQTEPFYKGEHGNWFKTKWKSKDIVIKTQTTFHLSAVLQVFVSYVLLNQTPLDQIPYTYGFFWIGHSPDGMKLDTSGEKRFCLVQQYKNGVRLSDKNDITLTQFKHYLLELLRTLETLSLTTYQISHNDVSPNNILITPEEHIVLVDFSSASCSIMNNGEEIRVIPNRMEEEYYNGEKVVSCVHNIIQFLIMCYHHPNEEIALFSFIQVQRLYQFFWREESLPIHISPDWITSNPYAHLLFHTLYYYELQLEPEQKKKVHHHNMTILKTLQYIWIIDFINM